MKKLTSLINEALASDVELGTIGSIRSKLKPLFASYSIPMVLEDVQISEDVITVEISITEDDETDEFELYFYVDDEVPQVLVYEDEEDDDYYVYSLENVASLTKGSDGTSDIVNLIEPAWLEEAVMLDILDPDDDIEEANTFVIRNGKKVKKKLVRSKRRKILTAKQKAGIRKAVKSRRAKKGQTARKRKISNKLRKRMKLKKNTNKRLKVAGTSSRK